MYKYLLNITPLIFERILILSPLKQPILISAAYKGVKDMVKFHTNYAFYIGNTNGKLYGYLKTYLSNDLLVVFLYFYFLNVSFTLSSNHLFMVIII